MLATTTTEVECPVVTGDELDKSADSGVAGLLDSFSRPFTRRTMNVEHAVQRR